MKHLAPSRIQTDSPTAPPVRVMIVDDSVVIRGLVTRWLNEAPGMIVVSSQRTGAGALRDLEASRPDVVVLDVEMPEMDGITALPKLLEMRPDLAVVMASSLTKRNAEISLRALQLGAKDYIPKPDGAHSNLGAQDFQRELIDKVRLYGPQAAQSLPESARAFSAPPGAIKAGGTKDYTLRPFSKTRPRVLTIGSSTGGPQALYKLFEIINGALDDVPVLITQHMPPNFTAILATHLSKQTGRPAHEGENREPLRPGNLYIAPGACHMLIDKKGGQAGIVISDAPPVNFCKPAVDPLFESVASVYGPSALAVVLTGMGRDGASGAVTIADAGGSVIAQDEESSVVWGMPGATAHAGACSAVLGLEKLGEQIVRLLKGRG
jgi:two-component system chemotaxis response regulator CheB